MGVFNSQIVEGAVFGRLTVVRRLPKGSKGRYRVLCRCACGKEAIPEVTDLLRGLTSSCGCRKAEALAEARLARSVNAKGYGAVKVGCVFERLTVIELLPPSKRRYAITRCQCGNDLTVPLDSLIQGNTRSCGCLASELTAKRNKEAGKFGCFSSNPETRPVFLAWRAVKNRCLNPRQKTYAFYGAKGIKVCGYLAESPLHLLGLLGPKPTAGHTLDRYPIHDGHYACGQCKECQENGWAKNVRWATRKVQSLNRGDFNVHLTAFGKTMTKSQWMEESGLSWSCLTGRLRRGWDVERALTTPDPEGNCYKGITNV